MKKNKKKITICILCSVQGFFDLTKPCPNCKKNSLRELEDYMVRFK